MSDQENESIDEAVNESSNELKEELDDLFGDEGEEEEEEGVIENDEIKSETEDIQSQSQSIRNNYSPDEDEEEEEETEKKVLDISLPRHAISMISENTQILKTPMHLNIAPHPFDPNAFKENIEDKQSQRIEQGLNSKQIYHEKLAEKLINESTIRWRYHNSGEDEIIKQSNAHFIQWDDGSVSLKIGSEMFDVKTLPITDNYLVKSYENAEILQSDSIIDKIINLFPASNDSIHKKLTQVIKNMHFKDKILNTTTEDDPLKQQRIADENEKKKLKMRRQMENKRRIEEEKWERGESPSIKESSYKRFARTYEDDDEDGEDQGEYDEEDDFIAGDEEEVEQYDDEEEEEEAQKEEDDDEKLKANAERLRKLKEDGAAKYREKSASVEENETRKRKRIIESDEEDE
ncbi:LEO1 [Candida jiufengensis]|uniref:LEO1 n=1 Tax=Candida jiufengensis TaxID=497108 RepID=UPI002223F0E9|nr:LEO1 [Candida jiufengensis]KAI5950098.1 LEO1 [Candida jiufengensis]